MHSRRVLPLLLLAAAAFRAGCAAAAGCMRSRAESRGFFCEDDASWRRRRAIFDAQEGHQVSTQFDNVASRRNAWWQGNYEPNFSCAHEERVGRAGDGGKWICDPYRIEPLSAREGKTCVVYSIGSNNDWSFEQSILKRLPTCKVFTFDHTIVPKGVPPGVVFQRRGLGPNNTLSLRTLNAMVKELNHDDGRHSIEILKIDIESHEWDALLPQLEAAGDDSFPFVRQMQIELHPRTANETRRFFQALKRRGFVITHKEPNLFQQGNLVEYAFLNLGWPVAAS